MSTLSLFKHLGLAALLPLSLSAFGQTTSFMADIPTTASGTYALTYTFGTTPFAANTKKTFIINGSDDTLCVDGKSLGKAFNRTAGAEEPLWADGTTYYGLSLVNGNFNEINVYTNANNSWVGQFTGTRTSTATTGCGTASGGSSAAPITISTDMQSVFDLAAELYPTLFKDGSALQTFEGYVYKFFAASGIYVGIKDNTIYLVGGQFGSAISPQGSVSTVLGALQTAKANLNKPTTPVAGGLFKLTVSGTVKTSGFASVSLPISISLNDMPAPSVSDTTVIVDQIKTQLGASGIANIKITSINNTSSRVTFRVEFTATVASLGAVTYDLTYDYTK